MTYIAQEQLCLNADRSKIVPCDSPDAAMNLALPGQEVPDDLAAKYGLAGKKKAEEPEEKAVVSPPENKAKNGAQSK